MSRTTARNCALRLLRSHGTTDKVVDVKDLAASLGLKVLETEIPGGISGLLISRGDISTICVHQGDSAQRQRFTIAHEIGHWCLHHSPEAGAAPHVHVNRGTLISERGKLASRGVDEEEMEANQFAAELLMPAHLLRKAVGTKTLPLREADIADLARQFEVSETAMTFRLRNLRLA